MVSVREDFLSSRTTKREGGGGLNPLNNLVKLTCLKGKMDDKKTKNTHLGLGVGVTVP